MFYYDSITHSHNLFPLFSRKLFITDLIQMTKAFYIRIIFALYKYILKTTQTFFTVKMTTHFTLSHLSFLIPLLTLK